MPILIPIYAIIAKKHKQNIIVMYVKGFFANNVIYTYIHYHPKNVMLGQIFSIINFQSEVMKLPKINILQMKMAFISIQEIKKIIIHYIIKNHYLKNQKKIIAPQKLQKIKLIIKI